VLQQAEVDQLIDLCGSRNQPSKTRQVSPIDAFSEALRQDANAYHVGYSLNRGPHTLSVAFSYFDDRRPLDADVASYGAVYTYAFSKRTDVSFVLTRFDNSDTAQVAPGQAGFYGGFASEPGEDVLSTAIGIRHRF